MTWSCLWSLSTGRWDAVRGENQAECGLAIGYSQLSTQLGLVAAMLFALPCFRLLLLSRGIFLCAYASVSSSCVRGLVNKVKSQDCRYRLVSNLQDEQHSTTPPEKMALEATKPEAIKDPWVTTGCPGDIDHVHYPTVHGGGGASLRARLAGWRCQIIRNSMYPR